MSVGKGTINPVTMDDVAAYAGVSRATVSRVLADPLLVSDSTKRRVLKAIDELNYVPNSMAQQLASRSSTKIGLLLRDPRRPAYGLLHSELQHWTHELGYQLVTVIPSRNQGEKYELEALNQLLGLRVAGLLIATGVLNTAQIDRLDTNIPAVSVGRPEENERIFAISHDEVSNAIKIADAAFNAGHRRVAIVKVSKKVSIAENLRSRSMIKHCQKLGITVKTVEATHFGVDSEGEEALLSLIKAKKVTAILFPSDNRMLIFISYAKQFGFEVNQDFCVAGIDGVSSAVKMLGFTTVELPISKVAEKASRVMADLIQGTTPTRRHELIEGKLFKGTSLNLNPIQ